MSVLSEINRRDHEHISIFRDPKTNVQFIIAIHDTTLGPALGGCRMRDYPSLDDALYDVLSLSEAMTYKNSLAGLNIGGGKSVIAANNSMKEGRAELFESFGRHLCSLGGNYITAEDMGTSVEDMSMILKTCEYVAGRDVEIGGGGDPSPWTAIGLFKGIKACLERKYSSGDYAGRHFSIQGVGHVGYRIAKMLAEAGGKLTLYDRNKERLRDACSEFSAASSSAEEIVSTDCDVFIPCATGGSINPNTVETLRCDIVAGAANNQVAGDDTERRMIERGILYAPDYAINAGGVILCADELEPGGYTRTRVEERVERIYDTVGKILDEFSRTEELPGNIALRLAKERINNARTEH